MSIGTTTDADLLAELERDYAATTPDAHVIATQLVHQKKTITKGKGKKAKKTPIPPPQQSDLALGITGIEPDFQLTGSSTLTLTIEDIGWRLLDSSFFDTDEDGKLDDMDLNHPEGSRLWWRLHQVSWQADHTLTAVFIPRPVSKLMNLRGPVKVARSKKTRAEFLKSLCAKVKDEKINLISTELHKKQPIAKVGTSMFSAPHPDLLSSPKSGGGGVGPMYKIVASAEDDPPGASASCGPLPSDRRGHSVLSISGLPGDAATAGQALSPGHLWPCGAQLIVTNPTNGRSATLHHVDNGAGSSFRPVIGIYPQSRADLGLSGGQFEVIIQAASGSPIPHPVRGTPTGGGGDGTGGGSGGAGSTTRTVIQPYYFEIQKNEDYWTGMQRLAQEVGWELFVVGTDVYFDADTELIKQPLAAVVSRTDQTVLDWSYDWENRHLATNFQLKMACSMFEFHAGEVLVLRGFGAASSGSTAKLPGYWMIGEVQRQPGDQFSTFTLVQPTSPKPEPAPQTTTVTSSGSSTSTGGTNSSGKFANPAPDSTTGRLDMGRDGNYSGKGAFALFAGVCHVIPGGPGWPGEGDYIWIRNDDQSGQWKAVYYAEGARAIVHTGQHVNAADKVGVPVAHGGTGAFGNFEIGPANPNTGDCAVKDLGLNSSAARQLVMDWEKLLTSLGMPPNNNPSAAGGP